MNKILVSAFLIIALVALPCFAADAPQGAPESQATVGAPNAPVQGRHLVDVSSDHFTRLEKTSPILEASSRLDGIAPQKTQFGEAAPHPQSQGAGAPDYATGGGCASCPQKAPDGTPGVVAPVSAPQLPQPQPQSANPCASCPKVTAGVDSTTLNPSPQVTPASAPPAVKSAAPEESAGSVTKECPSCQRNTRAMKPGQGRVQ
jgi:hypothetical protein